MEHLEARTIPCAQICLHVSGDILKNDPVCSDLLSASVSSPMSASVSSGEISMPAPKSISMPASKSIPMSASKSELHTAGTIPCAGIYLWICVSSGELPMSASASNARIGIQCPHPHPMPASASNVRIHVLGSVSHCPGTP